MKCDLRNSVDWKEQINCDNNNMSEFSHAVRGLSVRAPDRAVCVGVDVCICDHVRFRSWGQISVCHGRLDSVRLSHGCSRRGERTEHLLAPHRSVSTVYFVLTPHFQASAFSKVQSKQPPLFFWLFVKLLWHLCSIYHTTHPDSYALWKNIWTLSSLGHRCGF